MHLRSPLAAIWKAPMGGLPASFTDASLAPSIVFHRRVAWGAAIQLSCEGHLYPLSQDLAPQHRKKYQQHQQVIHVDNYIYISNHG